uniref:Uncharacterized protein n=1 Tax=Ixodes ricinus TaxID=34613 RepID=V5HB70_IXORI
MDKTLFYWATRSDRGAALAPVHPSDSEVDSSDDNFSDEEKQAEHAEESLSNEGRPSNGSSNSPSSSHSHRKLSQQSDSSLPSKKAKEETRVLVPFKSEADNRMAGKGRKGLQKSRK